MSDVRVQRFKNVAWTAMRVAVGIMFWSHGAQKLLGWFGGDTVELASRFGVAGILEFVGGPLIVLGLFTRPVAFILAGEMAVAYFWIHVGNSGLWWWANRGELAAVYAFVFLTISAFGAGPYSLDTVVAGRRAASGSSAAPPS